MLTEREIQKLLNQANQPELRPETPYPAGLLDTPTRPAAVLIPFLQKADGWHLLFIRRTVIPNDQHSGQVAFPGGRCNPDDPDAVQAALREAQEEVGLDPADVMILGRVQDMLTITNYRVTPVVGVIPWPYELIPQEDEVARIFTIPLNWLAEPANREIQMRGLQFLGQDVPVIFFKEYDGELLWGASARMTVLLLEALGFASPDGRYNFSQDPGETMKPM
jgi:8-oxo-dGTP pyrophosphatase MutT (NUDIX family)